MTYKPTSTPQTSPCRSCGWNITILLRRFLDCPVDVHLQHHRARPIPGRGVAITHVRDDPNGGRMGIV
eukprot:4322974-Amphidinium_carterae.2